MWILSVLDMTITSLILMNVLREKLQYSFLPCLMQYWYKGHNYLIYYLKKKLFQLNYVKYVMIWKDVYVAIT